MFFGNRSSNGTYQRIDVERQPSVVMRMRSSVAVSVAVPAAVAISISIGVPVAVPISVRRMQIRRVAGFHFGCDDQAFFVRDLDRERRATSRPHRGMALLHSQFDFLRIEVAATDDNQILQAPGDEQLAIAEESQISGAQKRTFSFSAR